MDAINQLLELDIVQWFYTGCIIIAGLVAIATLVIKFCDYINKPIKWVQSQNKDHDMILETKDDITALRQKHDEDVKQSIRHDNLIREDLSVFMEEIKSSINDTQNELKAFAQNRIHDREQSLQIQKDLTDSIVALTKSDSERNQQIESLIIGTRESLADRINQKYKYYLSVKGVPEDELDEFTSLHAAYKSVGGNHSGDAKYNYCIRNLPIIPVETKLKYDDKD